MPKAKRGSANYKAIGNGYQYEMVTVFSKENVAKLAGPVTFDGRVYPGYLDGGNVVFTSKKIDRNSYRVLFADRVNGDATQEFQYTVSSDDKTLTFSWLKGSPAKVVVRWVLVYERE